MNKQNMSEHMHQRTGDYIFLQQETSQLWTELVCAYTYPRRFLKRNVHVQSHLQESWPWDVSMTICMILNNNYTTLIPSWIRTYSQQWRQWDLLQAHSEQSESVEIRTPMLLWGFSLLCPLPLCGLTAALHCIFSAWSPSSFCASPAIDTRTIPTALSSAFCPSSSPSWTHRRAQEWLRRHQKHGPCNQQCPSNHTGALGAHNMGSCSKAFLELGGWGREMAKKAKNAAQTN